MRIQRFIFPNDHAVQVQQMEASSDTSTKAHAKNQVLDQNSLELSAPHTESRFLPGSNNGNHVKIEPRQSCRGHVGTQWRTMGEVQRPGDMSYKTTSTGLDHH